jgi:2,3-bisphosphoglycerate-dependent phosphoglycerate mutase
MDILLVRHGESESNLIGRLQGHQDSPLTPLGRAQAARLGEWLRARGLRWSAAYASPLSRARETASILAEKSGYPQAELDDDLREIAAGDLEGLTRDEMLKKYPGFIERKVTDLGDFAEFGGEGYEDVQARVARVLHKIDARHRKTADVVLLVAHGGINFQLVKTAVCIPVPRVCILHWGNCTSTLLRFRDRRGTYMAEVAWHVPVDLLSSFAVGNETPVGAESTGVFR